MRRSAEVIIVGAGPAGAATALLLARAGVDVLLLDRSAFPRPKPCGDCLSLGATSILARLGVLDSIAAARHAGLRGWRISAPDGAFFDASFEPVGDGHADADARAFSIERAVLDEILLRAAVAAGARFERAPVTALERDGRGAVTGVRTRTYARASAVVVGADGLRSIVARQLGAARQPGPLRKLSLTWHLPVDHAGDIGEMHAGDGLCAGVAPVDQHGTCNLTIVADSGRFGRSVARDPATFALSAIDSLPLLRGRVNAADIRNAPPLASGPFDRPVRRVAFDGAVLIGDAAGYYDPFTGQGVHQALASAEMLAPAIMAALNTGDTTTHAFSGYARSRAALLRGPRLIQRGIETVLSRPAIANRAIARIRRAPDFARAIIGVTGDIAPVPALLSRRALSSLLFPAPIPENAA
jgi:menaquinone-9 beta-reductase